MKRPHLHDHKARRDMTNEPNIGAMACGDHSRGVDVSLDLTVNLTEVVGHHEFSPPRGGA